MMREATFTLCLALCVVGSLGSLLTAQKTGDGGAPRESAIEQWRRESGADPRLTLRLRVTDVVRLVALNNSDLRVAYYDHLVSRTQIAEADAAFEPLLTGGLDLGTSETLFPAIFPTGQTDPNGEPTFFQTIVTDTTDVLNSNIGVQGLFLTGATYDLRMNTAFRDRQGGGLINPSMVTTTSLTVTQPILRRAWLQYNEAPIERARYAETMSRQRYRASVLAKIVEAETAYWNYVFALQDLEVKKRSLEVAQRLLEINRIKVRTGVSAPIEIASAEAGVAERETDLIVAEFQVIDSEDKLRRLILPFRTLSEWNFQIQAVDGPEQPEVEIPTLAECVEIARRERPDLAEARTALRDRALDVAVADNETLPKLDFTGQASFTGIASNVGDSIYDSFGPLGAESWNVGVSFEIPLGNRAARARLARARLQRDQAILSYRNAELAAVAQVRESYRQVRITAQTIEARRKTVRLREEELKNEQIKLEQKVSTNFQVLQVEEDLAAARSALLRALVDHQVALAALANAMGSTPDVLKWRLTAGR